MNVYDYLVKHDLEDTVRKGLVRLDFGVDQIEDVTDQLVHFQLVINHRAKSRFGQFSYSKRTIELTSEYFNKDWDSVKEDHHNTLLHEVAHLIVHFTYREKAKNFRYGGIKIESHGREWKSVMRALGLKPNRCGKAGVLKEASKAKQAKGKKHAYCCDRCDYVYKCNRRLKDIHYRRHGGGCGGNFIHRQLR